MIRREGGYQDFPSAAFGLKVLKKFVGVTLVFQNCSDMGKIKVKMEGITFFHRKHFVAHCQKNSKRNTSLLRRNFAKKFFKHTRRGDIMVLSNFFVSQSQIFLRRGLLCLKNALILKRCLWISRESGITLFRRNFFVS